MALPPRSAGQRLGLSPRVLVTLVPLSNVFGTHSFHIVIQVTSVMSVIFTSEKRRRELTATVTVKDM